jgi:hypothetical protein
VAADLDVRIELSLDRIPNQSSVLAPQVNELIGRYNVTGTPGNRMWRLLTDTIGKPLLTWSTDGTDFNDRVCAEPLPYFPGQRFALRATLDVDNGDGGHTVAFSTAPTMAGPWVPLGDPIVTAGTTSINQVGDASLEMGDINTITFAPGGGRYYGAELRSAIDGPVIASPDFTSRPDGSADFTDAQGNLWELEGGCRITRMYRRFRGEISVWPQRWDVSGKDVYVPIEASGILRRYNQGTHPVQSTLRRFIPDHDSLLSYWPMEDGADTTKAGSAIPGGPLMKTRGLAFASNADLASSAPLPIVGNGGSISAPLPPLPRGSNEWRVEMVYYLDSLPTGARKTMMRVDTKGGGIAAVRASYSEEGLQVSLLNGEGEIAESALVTDPTTLAAGCQGWSRFILMAKPGGAGTEYWALLTPIGETTIWGAFRSIAGFTKPTDIVTTFDPALGGMPIGHVTYTNDADENVYGGGIGGADDGFRGESALTRIRRIAQENGLLVAPSGIPAQSSPVGPQKINTAIGIVKDCVAVDGGVLFEYREVPGIQYRARHMRYNQRPALELDYAAPGEVAPPFEPMDDDLAIRNRVHITREDGATATAELTEGPVSTQSPPIGIGAYETSITLNMSTDDQAADHAGWHLHLGTVDAARYPILSVNLAAAPHLIEAVLSLDVGDVIAVRNPPPWLPPDMIRLVVQGYREVLGMYDWDFEFTCSPAEPWDVAVIGESRADTEGSELLVATGELDTELVVFTPQEDDRNRYAWVTAITPINPNVSFDTDVTGWTSSNAVISRAPVPAPLPFWDEWCIKVEPNGSSTDGNIRGTAHTPVGSIVAGDRYHISCWVYSEEDMSSIGPSVSWYDASDSVLSLSLAPRSIPAKTWTLIESTFTAPANASRALMAVQYSGTPPASSIWYADQVALTHVIPESTPGELPFLVRLGGEVCRVSVIEPFAWDMFTRTASNGWGVSASGDSWSLAGGADSERSVNGSRGAVTLTSTDIIRFQTLPYVLDDCEIRVRLSVSQVATGASFIPSVLLRFMDSTNFYRARVHFGTSGNMFTSVTRGSVAIGDSPALPWTYAADSEFEVRVRIIGHRVLLRVWPVGESEPWRWHIDRTVDAAPLIETGLVGVSASSFSGNTNANAQVKFDNFEIVTPQRFIVARSLNGVVKTHEAGTEVFLDQPPIAGL